MSDILLVEAHDVVYDALESWLKTVLPDCGVNRGCTVEEGLSIVRSQALSLVVLRDQTVGPVLTGAIEGVKQLAPNLPVVVLTDHKHPRRRRQAMAAGADAYVSTWRINTELQDYSTVWLLLTGLDTRANPSRGCCRLRLGPTRGACPKMLADACLSRPWGQ